MRSRPCRGSARWSGSEKTIETATAGKPAVFIAILLLAASLAFAADLKKLKKHQLQVDRLGPITVGMSAKEASAKSGIKLKETQPSDSGNKACYYVYPNGKYGDVGFMIEQERISRIDITSRKLASFGGIRVGDTEAAVKKAFPGKVEV